MKDREEIKIIVLSFFNNRKGDTTRNLIVNNPDYDQDELKETTRAYHAVGALDKFGANLGSNYRITKHGQEILNLLQRKHAEELFS